MPTWDSTASSLATTSGQAVVFVSRLLTRSRAGGYTCIVYPHALVATSLAYEMLYRQSVSYELSRSFWIRLLCATYCIAYISLSAQVEALIGVNGLIPITSSIKTIKKVLDTRDEIDSIHKFLLRCTLDLFNLDMRSQGRGLRSHANICAAVSALGVLYPHFIILVFLYLNYSCFKRVCGVFLNLQWDALLLEAGFVSIFYALSSSKSAIALCTCCIRLLLFRLMFGSGMVKLYSRDSSWWGDFTAMEYHYLTQPLPGRFAPFLHALPRSVLRLMTIGTLIVEVLIPILSMLTCIPFSSTIAVLTFLFYSLLQLSIMLSGHFGFFNWLSMFMGLSLLSDSAIYSLVSYTTPHFIHEHFSRLSPYVKFAAFSDSNFGSILSFSADFIVYFFVAVYSIITFIALERLYNHCGLPNLESLVHQDVTVRNESPEITTTEVNISVFSSIYLLFKGLYGQCAKLYLGNHYGLFASMTKKRDEVIIEVSKDGKSDWKAVEFSFKPVSPHLPPKPVSPPFHLPRIDWQLWFVALRSSSNNWEDWLWNLLISILECNQDVLQALDVRSNSFLDPSYKFIRVRLFNYTFHCNDNNGINNDDKRNNFNNNNYINTSNTTNDISNASDKDDPCLIKITLSRDYSFDGFANQAGAASYKDLYIIYANRDDCIIIMQNKIRNLHL